MFQDFDRRGVQANSLLIISLFLQACPEWKKTTAQSGKMAPGSLRANIRQRPILAISPGHWLAVGPNMARDDLA